MMAALFRMPQVLPAKPPLSRREKDIVALVAEGLSNREIAERLFISERTVDSHLEHVREKLAVNTRAQVAAWFVAQSHATARAVPSLRPPQARRMPVFVPIAAAGLLVLGASVGAAALVHIASNGTSSVRSSPPVGALKLVWDTYGAEHPFSFPGPIALGSHGTVYVLDRGHDSVQELDSNGSYVTSWGGRGQGKGQFIVYCPTSSCPPACTSGCRAAPGSIAVDREGRVWVLDYVGRVQVFDDAGDRLFGWGQKGSGQGELQGDGSIAFDSAGNVVIADPNIQRFTWDGRYLGQIGNADQYLAPAALAIDSHDDIYAGDWITGKILKYNSKGRLLWSISGAVLGPQALATDKNDDLWVLENPGGYLKKFDPAGHLLRAWSTPGFTSPFGLAIDASGAAFVTDLPGGTSPDVGRLSKVIPLG
jgi:DNA-binding CsgD family transcriptional regulator/DNA-binding beta-propeller fold protein YncE